MLRFVKKTGNRGKVQFQPQYRYQFDILQQSFKRQNDDYIFAKQYSYNMERWKYAISNLGSFQIGQTDDFLKVCRQKNIKYQLDPQLQKVIHPKLYINEIQNLPNPSYQYRDYQYNMIKSLSENGRGVIISPTRSGKSLILSGLFHNILLNSQKNDIKNILLIVPNLLLVQQFVNDLNDYFSIKQQKITITLQNNIKIELDGQDLIQTKRGKIKAKELTKTDEITQISF